MGDGFDNTNELGLDWDLDKDQDVEVKWDMDTMVELEHPQQQQQEIQKQTTNFKQLDDTKKESISVKQTNKCDTSYLTAVHHTAPDDAQKKDLNDPSSTYFGFGNAMHCCADYKVNADECLLVLSGFAFHGGPSLQMNDNHIVYTDGKDKSTWNGCYGSFFIRSAHKNK